MLLMKLLQRGDRLSVESGRLKLVPQSGKQAIADKWLADNHDPLLSAILEATGRQVFRFTGHTTGCYGRHRSPGVTLQFVDLTTGEKAYCIFNAELHRKRNTQHGAEGSMLPKGQFHPPKGGEFVAFWKRCGLALPRRLSAFHDYVGKLKQILIVGEMNEKGKLINGTVGPLEISHAELLKASGVRLNLPDNCRTTSGQFPDNFRTRFPDKETLEAKCLQGIWPDSGTCAKHYGNKVNGNTFNGIPSPAVEEDDWLRDYDQGLAVKTGRT